MEEYRSNSDRSREQRSTVEEKKVEKIVNGSVKVRKKTKLQKFVNAFVSEDIDDVGNYIIEDILVPKAKDVILSVVESLLGMDRHSNTPKSSGGNRISYRNYYSSSSNNNSRETSRNRSVYDYDNVILDSYGEADSVLTRMDELMGTYNIVSVADYYEMVGVPTQHTDFNYGWTDIRSAKIVREREGGYSIKLPRAVPID